jgi:diguanylate cyclase (GGDEF)-like protein
MVVNTMAECGGLQYYLFFLIALLLGSVFYSLKLRQTLKIREESEISLVKEAYSHPVSGLPNRKNIDIMVSEQIHRVHRHAQSFLVTVIRVKNYNDISIRSKTVADEFISEAANRIVDTVRDEDMVAHVSDNTFIILFNEYLQESNYDIIFQRLNNAFEDKYQVEVNKSLEYEITLGHSQYPNNGTDSDILINEAIRQALK